jgi:hypothetical protein
MSAPSHGQTVGMNFDVIFDNEGGTRTFVDNHDDPRRFTVPRFVDDHIQGAHSSFHDSLAGLRGPVNYAKAIFLDPAAAERPAAIQDLTVARVSARGARLLFTAPAGTTSGAGHISSYEIRLSAAPIGGEAAWEAATVFAQLHAASPGYRRCCASPGCRHRRPITSRSAPGTRPATSVTSPTSRASRPPPRAARGPGA